MTGKTVQLKKTGEVGVVTKVINGCLWVKMKDGCEYSGHKSYWKVLKESK